MSYNKINRREPSPNDFNSKSQRGSASPVTEFEMYPTSQNESTTPIMRPSEKTNSWKPKIIAAPAWEHPLSQKHLARAPSESDATRYFDRTRQCRRVFLDGVYVWSATAFVCAGMFGVMYYYSHLDFVEQHQKYQYNALITGFSILLGLTFAAQFKQYCEFLRWRFLASGYRTVTEFDDVLGCDGWRTTLKLIFHRHGKGGRWYPAKSQVLAFFWLVTFIAFNVFVALIGLTYSMDNSEEFSDIQPGNVSVTDLRYISTTTKTGINLTEYPDYNQRSAASIWGIRGQDYRIVEQSWEDFWSTQASTPKDNLVSTFPPYDVFWHIFVDYAADNDLSNYFFSTRSVNVSAVCQEIELTQGGYAGYDGQSDAAGNPEYFTSWINSTGREDSASVDMVQAGLTTWMGRQDSDCGPRCTTIIVLQSANNQTQEDLDRTGNPFEVVPVFEPRIWECNNTVGQVDRYDADTEGFRNPELLAMPDNQAKILAGTIGWSGLTDESDETGYQQNIVRGDNSMYNPAGNATDVDIAKAIMKYTTGAIAAMDQPNGHRQRVEGQNSPVIAQQLNVKWHQAGPILAGIPGVQFLMLFFVVWLSRKAIVLEPSAITFAHLLYPVMKDLGEKGALMSGDEIEEKLGPDYRISYSVRPDPEDPGRHEKDHVRHLGVLRETDGYGYVRGAMPEGRYA